jgi:hypothetical protein
LPRVRVVLTRLAFDPGHMTGIRLAVLAERICGASTVLTDSHDPVLLHALPGFEEQIFLRQPCSPAQVLNAVADAWMYRRRVPTQEDAESGAESGAEPEEDAG